MPTYKIAHLPIRLVADVDLYDERAWATERQARTIPIRTWYSLLDVLDAIYYEISFYGSPAKRDDEESELLSRANEVVADPERATVSFDRDEVQEVKP